MVRANHYISWCILQFQSFIKVAGLCNRKLTINRHPDFTAI